MDFASGHCQGGQHRSPWLARLPCCLRKIGSRRDRTRCPVFQSGGYFVVAMDGFVWHLSINAIRQPVLLGIGDGHIMLVADLELQGVQLGIFEIEPQLDRTAL